MPSRITRTTTSDRFAIGLQDVLDEFGSDVETLMPKCVKAAARVGSKAASQFAPRSGWTSRFGGGYANAFSYRVESSKGGRVVTGVVRNRIYQLVHLLEKGHRKIGGGMVAPRVHMSIAKGKAEEELVKRLKTEIGEIR